MSEDRKDKADSPFPDDLERDPGIGQSKGTFATGERPDTIKGESTVEGDVDNDSTVSDGIPQRERGRTNE